MEYVVYDVKLGKKARLHDEDCDRLYQTSGGGMNGSYRYFSSYEEAWEYLEDLENDGWDVADCFYCNPS